MNLNLTQASRRGHLSCYACSRAAGVQSPRQSPQSHCLLCSSPSSLAFLAPSPKHQRSDSPLSSIFVRCQTPDSSPCPSGHNLFTVSRGLNLDKEVLYIMSTRALRGAAVRSYRRRKTALDLDLNRDPPVESRELEGPSAQLEPQAGLQLQVAQAQPAMIDVEAIDDDVVESTPRAFAEAKNNSRRNRSRAIVDVDLDRTRVTNNNRNKRRRGSPSQTIINCDLYINLEGSSGSMKENVRKSPEPPKEPVFNCPICMGPLAEEMSTRCGHIFCKSCIKAAINAQGKCPTCRKKVTAKELIRVFLPSTT
ncbi:uncharacterized protein LOC129311096 isoform X2 [Prosopis cineraria]|uniref:uncharacterized protein LOC129311096 isoform X2 n=1 Tax=Prosopis cineraria TaxID=364024 RepID=UPI00241059D4|nr:uncharacterized protein LOC129311096 isoform X2 [Prosopis cineraria]